MAKLTEKKGSAAFWANACFQENNNVIGHFDHDHAEGTIGYKLSYSKSYVDELEKVIKKFNIQNPNNRYFWALFDHFYDAKPGEMDIPKSAKGADIAEGIADLKSTNAIVQGPNKKYISFNKNHKRVVEILKDGPQDRQNLQEDLKQEFNIYEVIDKLLLAEIIKQDRNNIVLNAEASDIIEKAIKEVDELEAKKEPVKAYFLGNFKFERSKK
jgi:hypothetical protein